MDNWISGGIEDELRISCEKRSRYNRSRKEIRERELNINDLQYLHTKNQISDKKILLTEDERMETEETTDQIQYLLSSSTKSSYIMNHKFNNNESSSSYDYNGGDDDDDDEFEIINSYESFLNSDLSDSSSDEEDKALDKTLLDPLHLYTNVTTSDACVQLVHLLRSSQISKDQSKRLLSFIHDLLPIPNNFPKSLSKLLCEINIQKYYHKRIMCSLCGAELDEERKCFSCNDFEKKHLAFIYDTQFMTLLTMIVSRLFQQIESYRQSFSRDDNTYNINETRDIPFASIYQRLRKSHGNKMITLLLHLDGIGICKSTKLKMWILTASIIELPPNLRHRRENMPLISLWFSCSTPNIDMWLSYSIEMLKSLKMNGISIGKNLPTLNVLYYGVIGDCPALSLITKLINHGGYYCCFYCYIKGVHNRICKKRQYPLSLPLCDRDPQIFAIQARKAHNTGKTVYGHKGESKLSHILDVPLPMRIICDYQHVTLLRLFRDVVKMISSSLPTNIRKHIDYNLRNQPFPHFFNRKMRGIDEFSYIKASELRNLLLYGFIPNFYDLLNVDQAAHMCLFICGIRLIHCSNENFGQSPSSLAADLLETYYKYHNQFYDYLENFVLHLHIHYAINYDQHGALSCVNTFAQESLIGYIASNRNGTRELGDLIMHYYNIDMCLSSKTNGTLSTTSIEPLDTISDAADLYINRTILEHHTTNCKCGNSSKKCIHFYQRLNIRGRIFHSKSYRKKGLCNSYAIQYLNHNVSNNTKQFGEIVVFFSNQTGASALVKILVIQQLLSNHFKPSRYYKEIRKLLDAFYYMVTHENRFACIPVANILRHCILFTRHSSKLIIITPVSSYEEHD